MAVPKLQRNVTSNKKHHNKVTGHKVAVKTSKYREGHGKKQSSTVRLRRAGYLGKRRKLDEGITKEGFSSRW